MRTCRAFAVLGLVYAVGACQDLDVLNTNLPDQARAISEPGDVESLIAGSFQTWFYGYSDYYPAWALSVAADEASSSWGNAGMRDISEEPRKQFPNSTGYSYDEVARNPWYDMYGAISATNDGLRAIAEGLEIGEDGADTQRAIAFAKFMQGMAHAYLALTYDRAFVFTEDIDLESAEFELVDYNQMMDVAITMMDQAIVEAGKSSFPLPDHWMATSSLTNQDLIQLANSYVARFMASVARTPAERAAVNWQEVINRINAGITEDFGITLDNTDWGDSFKGYTQRYDWFRSDMRAMIGPADISGAYQDWLATPVGDRIDFDIDTPDQRIQGGAVGVSGTDFTYRRTQNHRADRGTYHFSRYHWTRYFYIRTDQIGFDPIMAKAEMDLLKAEAYIRLGQPDAAVPLINATRVSRGGLPPVSETGPTGADCVPKKLVDPAGGCADLMSTLMWEKRIETFSIAAGVAYWDARGWGLLVTGTPYHLPIPARELETLQLPLYTFGGVGGEGAAQ
ncbi:MAG: hypothetical protein ACREL7_04845 [Longimicrobiales bacterium]